MPDTISKLESIAVQCDEFLINEFLSKLVAEANSAIPQVDIKDINIQSNILFLDVREPEEFASGYIPARNVLTIPRGKLEFMAIEKIAKIYGQNAKIITYCLKGPRGSLAAYQLKKLGFADVSNLKGGILEWIKNGNSIKNYLGEFRLI
jgi:rhodanese-related sulfurtransferase